MKVFVRASKSGPRCKTGYEDGAVEVYDRGRFFTVTGARLSDRPAGIEERQAAFDAVYAPVFGKPQAPPVPQVNPSNNGRVLLDDNEIIRLACASRKSGAKFAALWAGRWNEHFNSPSEADSSFAFILAFYTKDAGQIDRIVRRSAVMRGKWDKRHGQQTYGEMTIAKALATVTKQYQPRKRRTKTKKPGSADPSQPFSEEPLPDTIDPATGRLILSKERTLPIAKAYVCQFQHPEILTLRHYAGLLMTWWDNREHRTEATG